MICKQYREQIPCSQACVRKILGHLTTSRLEEHIWLDAPSLRQYMPTEPNQWLTEMWLWQETTAWRQDTKELHNPTLFITSAKDRQSERYVWNPCLLRQKTAQMPLDVILLQRLLSINICIVCLSFYSLLVALWVYGFSKGSDRQANSLPFLLFALFRNWHRSRHDVWSTSFFLLSLGDTLRGQMSWNSWTLLYLHNKKRTWKDRNHCFYVSFPSQALN